MADLDGEDRRVKGNRLVSLETNGALNQVLETHLLEYVIFGKVNSQRECSCED